MVGKNFFDDNLENLKECVKLASNEIMNIYNSDDFGQEKKLDGSPLTLADKRANKVILNSLKEISKHLKTLSLCTLMKTQQDFTQMK